jgi:hypothetical protein
MLYFKLNKYNNSYLSDKVVAPSKLLQLVGARLISDNLSDYDKLRLCIICTICIDMVEKGMNKTLKFCYYLEFFSIQYNIITRSQGSD